MVKISSSTPSAPKGRIGQQVGVKPRPTATITPAQQKQIKAEVKQTKPEINYEAAWKTAKAHWMKGKAGAYLYWMKKEAAQNPGTAAVYAYVKELDRQTRAGNISPGRTSGSLLSTPKEVAKQRANLEFMKRTGGDITPSQKLDLELTPGQRLEKQMTRDQRIIKSKYVKDMHQPTGTIQPTKRKDMGEEFLFGRILGSDPNITPLAKYKYGKEFSLRYSHMYFGKQLGDWFGEKVPSKVLEKKAPQWLTEISAELPTWIGLNPLIKTGTAARLESQYADEVVEVIYKGKKVKMTLSQAKSMGLEPMTRVQATSAFSALPEERQIQILKKAFRGVGGEKKIYLDKPSLLKDVKLATKFMRESGLTQSQINSRINTLFPGLMREEVSTVLIATSEGGVIKPTSKVLKPTTRTWEIELPQVITMERLDVVGASTSGLFQPSKVGQAQWIRSSASQQPKTKQYQPTLSMTTQKSAQGMGRPQISRLGQPQIQLPKIGFATPQSFGLKSKSSFGFPKIKIGQDSASGKIPKILWLRPKGKVPLTKKKAVSFVPQVMMKGKWKTIGKRMDRRSALSRASEGADKSTSRRIRIKPSNKPVQVTNIMGWSMRRYKFRPYKKSRGRRIPLQNQYIEKKTFAIDTPGEVGGLSIAKLSKNMGWLSVTKKAKKKKKTKNKGGKK